MFSSTPVQLTVDPCTLVTQEEAQTTLGHPATEGLNGTVCTYTANGNGGHIAVETVAPDFCKLLFLALDKNIFGGAQVRIDNIASGGMLVKGNGNVQIVVHGGCLEVAGRMSYDKKVDDDTMLGLAKTAAGRVT